MNITIKLGHENDESTHRQVTVDAFCVGDWASHGAFMKHDDDQPSESNFVVTHIPSGRSISSLTGLMTREESRDLVVALSNLGPMPTAEAARERKDDIVKLTSQIAWEEA